MTHLGPDDTVALGMRREQDPIRWLEILCGATVELRDTEPCERDHCDDIHPDEEIPNAG